MFNGEASVIDLPDLYKAPADDSRINLFSEGRDFILEINFLKLSKKLSDLYKNPAC